MVTCELAICDKLNWNAALVNFDLFSLNPVLITTGVSSKTP